MQPSKLAKRFGSKLRSLLPKTGRKYQVDESSRLVISGRAFLKWYRTTSSALLTWTYRETRATSRWAAVNGPTYKANLRFDVRRFRLTFRWKRVPKVWEMLFIDRMEAAKRIGIPFVDILKETLPNIMGIDGTRVLGYWTGRHALVDPETFVLQTEKLFGRTSKLVVLGVFDNLDEGKMLVDRIPEESKLQSVVDAINLADEREAALTEMRATGTGAIVPLQQSGTQFKD